MNTPFDQTLESDMKELMKEVPPPIRAVFASGKVEVVAKSLMQKNKLHIDQCAVVEREIILLLLGLKSPDEFTKTLAEEARLDQQTVNNIVRDVNEQIFVPLREEMRKSQVAEVKPTQPAPSSQSQAPRLLEDHEEPHIEFKKTTPLPPPNLPGVIHHSPLASPKATATPPKPISPVPPPAPIIKEYSSDPYREPIDEGGGRS